jgi:hypothetical protein
MQPQQPVAGQFVDGPCLGLGDPQGTAQGGAVEAARLPANHPPCCCYQRGAACHGPVGQAASSSLRFDPAQRGLAMVDSRRPSSQDIAGNKSAIGAMKALGKVVAERDSVSGGMAGRTGAEVWGEGGLQCR